LNLQPYILAIVQARMGSSRLPGKVLLDIAGQPMLARVVERARRAKTVSEVLVATTTDPADDGVADLCRQRRYPCYRGSLYDVLDRYYLAARSFEAEVIVRLTADCPLIDPGVIDEVVNKFLGMPENEPPFAHHHPQFLIPYDFAANRLPPPWGRTYPIGLDVEVCTFLALERAWKEADQPYQREHVMPYLYEREGRFRVLLVNHNLDYGHLRWTVDTLQDLELIRQVYSRFAGREDFTWLDVLALFEREPELARINAQVQHRTVRDVDERRTS
jgi:spore coat polysaccharide biosynthesis protein SpsF